MPTNTPILGLVLPGFGEYSNSWWQPLNKNLTTIDTHIGAIETEIVAARQGKASLLEFLSVGMNSDGTLLATPEVAAARNSFTYGNRQAASPNTAFDLVTRLNSVDKEVWYARELSATLLDNLAARNLVHTNSILSGTKDANGYPTWMGKTGVTVNVNGLVTPAVGSTPATGSEIKLMIGGYLCRIRTNMSLTISGTEGAKYVYATRQPAGVITVDGDNTTAPPSAANGVTSADDTGDMILFTDLTVDFTTRDVKAGDLLTLINGSDAGTYIIKEVAPDDNTNQLKIVGTFPVGGLSQINYTVTDPLGVVLGFSAAETDTDGRLYIGEADFSNGSVSEVRPRHFKDTFISEWVQVTGGTVLKTFDHRLGSDKLSVSVQVSQANNGSAAVEELSVSGITSDLSVSATKGDLAATNGVTVSGAGLTVGTSAVTISTTGVTVPAAGLTLSAITLSSGTVTVPPTVTGSASLSGSAPTLSGSFSVGGSATVSGTISITGSPTVSLVGSVKPTRSVAAKWDKNTLTVKNAAAGVFYTDFDGNTKTGGWIRVVVQKRG